eukprot:1955161-Pyramimonas_sp.AAC.1
MLAKSLKNSPKCLLSVATEPPKYALDVAKSMDMQCACQADVRCIAELLTPDGPLMPQYVARDS